MWSNQPTPTTTEHSTSVSAEKITPQQSHPAFWHQTKQRCCSAHTQLWFGREPNMWKVNDQDWFEVAAGIQARSRSQCSMRDSWTVCQHWTPALFTYFSSKLISPYLVIFCGRAVSYECVETRGGRHKSHRKGRMTHFLHCVIQPFPPLPSPSPWGRAETRRVEESQKSLWVSGQISRKGVADSFLRNACIFLGRKKMKSLLPLEFFFFFRAEPSTFHFDCDLLYLLQLRGRNDFNSLYFKQSPNFSSRTHK